MARRLLGIGLPNHALTLTDRAPVLIMPIIATEFLSPLATAYWYTAWMMAWVVFIVPRSFGLTLFAEVAEAPASFARRVWRSVWWSLLVGVVVALGVALVAPFILSVLGHSYSSAGTAPLRLLVLAVVPLSFTEAYFAACRGTQRLREAIIVGVMSGIVSISGAAAVAHAHGLASMAVAWLAAQTATGIWAGLRLRSLCGIRRPNGFALAPALRQPRSTESHP
jgi:O-antigen/teichoic acid export membrane protein